MKARGFTLLELVIVLALIGITSVISLRFISHIANRQVASAERAQVLAGARFAMERLRRELSQAYSPSVYVDGAGKCVAFVPVLAAGRYVGEPSAQAASFYPPLRLPANWQEPLPSMTIAAASNSWQDYPADLPANVMQLTPQVPLDAAAPAWTFESLFGIPVNNGFSPGTGQRRYTLLLPQQVRFCVVNGQLTRSTKRGGSWADPVLMLKGITHTSGFSEYNEALQLLSLDLNVHTQDGDLALSSQLQVNYGP